MGRGKVRPPFRTGRRSDPFEGGRNRSVRDQAAEDAKNQTSTIPIVMVGVSDPVGSGLVTSLARPGGNVTGTSSMATALVAKQLELLKLVVPDRANIAAMFNPTNVTFQTQQVKEAKKASEKLGLQLRLIEVREPSEFEAAFDAVARERIGVLLILADPLFFSNSNDQVAAYYHDCIPDLGRGRRS